ncbi:leucine--tRNA ligase [Mesomycoplasma flocculare]|uniref:Leucine--tRNA ligase n=1 Tax=Mesomycoplasma flocculare ATCC 27399 TaxID=743971 RepID=A0A0A8E950_MESFC|nr:leucine--tRNA ligase [Mesomycoplasma flocculare]AJC50107.1 leucyl-tRNA synthetase [Mesomycoplasma flocculare ATCC 27399]ENX50790.1 leucyl-tRNA synthetase [Mesomycoplasma flocculare ATCC 27716]
MLDHRIIEKKWQNYWYKNNVFQTTDSSKKKFYILDMFPYPSASGLHLGHPIGYTASDIVARFKRLNGFDVLHPMGWDAFGLPAEQYAIKTGNHPGGFTKKNIKNFKKQIISFGFSYDWNKEVNTSDPEFYEQTQWIFKLLYKANLAEIRDVEVNWCPELGTVLANEELKRDKNGNFVSERGNFPVVLKKMKQWVLKITEYAQKLLDGLDDVSFPDSLKTLQRKWIGKSEGWKVKFPFKNKEGFLEIFTTRIETFYGVSFLAISPLHSFAQELAKKNAEISQFIKRNSFLSPKLQSKTTGIFTNLYVKHPLNSCKIPIYIANYVINDYASSAIMGVPAHNLNDLEFARIFKINYISVINSENLLINSAEFNGKNSEKAKNLIFEKLKSMNLAEKSITFRLKDWVFSRQRYWGEPFPVYFDETGKIYLEEKIVKLPYKDKITPSGDMQSPLASIKDWVFFEKDGKTYRRETNTMPQWAGSSWYYLAFILKEKDKYLKLNTKPAFEKFQKWLPVDLYIGGQEHAVGHLIYSRFWHKVLFEAGVVPNSEPFKKIIHQGMLLGPDGQKMSKSKGNVINPSQVIEEYGADSVRLFLMFMGPISENRIWDENGLKSIYNWIQRVIRTILTDYEIEESLEKDHEFTYFFNNFVFEITALIESFKFNVAISKLMAYINFLNKKQKIPSKKYLTDFLIIFSVFAPHIAEELLEKLGEKPLNLQSWPQFDKSKIVKYTYNLPVSVNGKNRAILELNEAKSKDEIIEIAKKDCKIRKYLNGMQISKVIFIPKKILNFIVKSI